MSQNKEKICLLAIESSCDDTGAAVIINGKMHSNVVATQKIHQKYGGVVPELASREHLQNIIPVVTEALKEANITTQELSAVAYAQGPGLMGSLMVGSSYARALSSALEVPSIGIDHLKAHVMAHFIDEPKPLFPFICLLVSGGHTQIILVKAYDQMEILGKTHDDAAGEAFDKTAKMMGLPYPGGPLIDKYAQLGNPEAYAFSYAKMPGYDYSFSGFKTAVLYFLRDNKEKDPSFIDKNLNDICASVQRHIVTSLLKNLKKAVRDSGVTQVALAGGVAANSSLRNAFLAMGEENQWETFIPAFEYCTDNAAMIAVAGHFAFLNGDFTGLDEVPYARFGMKV
jgi:N6-L-threonylcarbamoyladenine synthase